MIKPHVLLTKTCGKLELVPFQGIKLKWADINLSYIIVGRLGAVVNLPSVSEL